MHKNISKSVWDETFSFCSVDFKHDGFQQYMFNFSTATYNGIVEDLCLSAKRLESIPPTDLHP